MFQFYNNGMSTRGDIISDGMNYILIIKNNELVSRLNGLRVKLTKSGRNRREAYDVPDYLLGHSLGGAVSMVLLSDSSLFDQHLARASLSTQGF